MYKSNQRRKYLLCTVLALAMFGSGISRMADANPLMLIVRTASVLNLALKASSLLADPQKLEANTTASNGQSYPAMGAQRSLVLQIPPLSESLCAQLLIVAVDVNTGERHHVAQLYLTVLPDQLYQLIEVPLHTFKQQGLFQFQAIIPAFQHAVRIAGTESVLLL